MKGTVHKNVLNHEKLTSFIFVRKISAQRQLVMTDTGITQDQSFNEFVW